MNGLKEILEYQPDTGLFFWRVKKAKCIKPGQIAGRLRPDGYIDILINRKRYLASRLAWIYMTEVEPPNQVDHENGVRSDNRWRNLRLATNGQNQQNATIRSNNTSGFKGVSFHKGCGKYRAYINSNGKRKYLGLFETATEAAQARNQTAMGDHGEFARMG